MAKAKRIIQGIFFWRKRKETFEDRFKALLPLLVEYAPLVRKALRNEADIQSDGTVIGRMYDFFESLDPRNIGDLPDNGPVLQLPENDERVKAKPVTVISQLERVPLPFDLVNLDEKIKLFEMKSSLISQRYSKAQVEGFIQRLHNRKHYENVREFYEQFPNTTDEKIDALLAKYKLEIGDSDLFIPTLPKDAVLVMKEYSDITKSFTNEKPVFYIIAEAEDFEEKRDRLDPILLVQSPFGFYWQILGAWDKEMLLLSEL